MISMLAVYLGIYTLILLTLWGFFLVARHHAYRFRDFSTNIVIVTRILLVFLVCLTLGGFYLIFYVSNNGIDLSFGNTVQESISETPKYQKYY